MRTACVLVAALILATLCAGRSQPALTGTWIGKLDFDYGKVRAKDAGQAAAMREALSGLSKNTSLTLTLRQNKTYLTVVVRKTKEKTTTQKIEGAWKLSGLALTLIPKKRDGKAVTPGSARPQVFALSKDRKALSRPLAGLGPGSLVYRRK